jgi:predicted N-acetyltransferase YhbS
MKNPLPQLIQLQKEHIPQVIQLSDAVGWDYDRPELETVFNTGSVWGHVTHEGRLVSSGAVFPYGDQLASIGLIMVHPEYQGQGFGREVTEACMRANLNPIQMLVATSEGIPVYRKLGFRQTDSVHKCIATEFKPIEHVQIQDRYRCRPYRSLDFEQVCKLDREAFGADRSSFLSRRLDQAYERLVITDTNGLIVGYGLAVERPHMLLIGPLVTPDDGSALTLLHFLAAHYNGPLRIDIPSGKEAFVQSCVERSFHIVRQPPLMLRGTENPPQRNGRLYALASQAFG